MESTSAPTQVQSLLEAGLAALDAGDYDTALEKWNEVLKYDPLHMRAAKLVKDLEALVSRARGTRMRQRTNSGDLAVVVEGAAGRSSLRVTGSPAVVVTGSNPVVSSEASSPGTASAESAPAEGSEPLMASAPAGSGSWAAASDTEKEALRRLQELLGTQEIATERQAQELQQLRSQVSKLRSDLASRERELLAEREAQIQTDARLESLETELAELRKVSRDAQKELAQEKLTTAEMHQRIAQFQGENQALYARIHEIEPHVEALQQRDEELTHVLAEQGVLREEVQRLNDILSEERQRQLSVEHDRRAAERSQAAALAAATVELDTANVAREQMRQRVDELQAQLQALHTQQNDAAARNDLMSSQLEVERERVRTLTTQLEAAREQAESAAARYEAAMNELQGVRAQLDVTRDEGVALQRRLQELQRAHAAAQGAASATTDARVRELEQQLQDMEQDLTDFAHAHENASQQLRDLRSELLAAEAARATMAERLTQQEEKYDRVVTRATTAEAQIEPLRSERDSARRALEEAENTIRTLRARQVALESEVRAMQDTSREVRSLRQQRSQLDQKLAETSGRLKTLELELAEPKVSDSGGFARVGSSPGRRRPRTDVRRMSGEHFAVPTNTPADEIAPVTLASAEPVLRRPTEVGDEPVIRMPEPPAPASTMSSVDIDEDLDAVLDGFDELDQEFEDDGRSSSAEIPPIAALPVSPPEMFEEDIPTHESIPVFEPEPPVTNPRAVEPQVVEHILGAIQPIPASQAHEPAHNRTLIGRPLPPQRMRSGTYSGPQPIMVGLERVTLDPDEVEEDEGVIDASDMAIEEEEPLLTFEPEPDDERAPMAPPVSVPRVADAPAPSPAPPPAPAGRAARNALISEYLKRVPRLGADALERRSTLGAREAFVIQNIDGTMSFADLLDVCGLPPQETQAILQALYDRGIIDFDLDR